MSRERFRADVLAGLRASPKTLPSRWLYDRTGSALFDAITALPEYELTRLEGAILAAAAGAVRAFAKGASVLVEYGAGSGLKTERLMYDDSSGVTARFNLNLLGRINRELGGEFLVDRFRHRVRWNSGASVIEMHLESKTAQTVPIGDESFRFSPGETIHTENSFKYDAASFSVMAREAGWRPVREWSDAHDRFALFGLE